MHVKRVKATIRTKQVPLNFYGQKRKFRYGRIYGKASTSARNFFMDMQQWLRPLQLLK